LLIIDYIGTSKTSGARALSFAADILLGRGSFSNNAESSVMALGLVDANTRNILWTNISALSKDVFTASIKNMSSAEKIDVEKVNQLISNALEKLNDK
jgi:hypothetical protein